MLEIQKELRNRSLFNVIEDFNLKASYHKDYPNLVCLKYNQVKSPFYSELVRECRGIILDMTDNYKVVSYPFKKFFNYTEGYAPSIDWETAKVQEKLDGSMMVLYPYNGNWEVQSSGKPDASGTTNNSTITFRDLFWETWRDLSYKLPNLHNMCFIFELITPYNKVIVNYKKPQLVLIGARDLDTLKEISPKVYGEKYGWETAQEYPIKDIKTAINTINNFSADKAEGFIVVDNDFNRIKIKSRDYILWANVAGGFKDSTYQKILTKIINEDEMEEFLSYFPQYKNIYLELNNRYQQLLEVIEVEYKASKNIVEQKDFALSIKGLPYKGVLFEVRKTGATIKEVLKRSPVDKVYNLI